MSYTNANPNAQISFLRNQYKRVRGDYVNNTGDLDTPQTDITPDDALKVLQNYSKYPARFTRIEQSVQAADINKQIQDQKFNSKFDISSGGFLFGFNAGVDVR